MKHRVEKSLMTVGSKISDASPAVRLAAVKGVSALAEVRKSEGIKLLARCMEDSAPACVREAAKGLRSMNFEDATLVLEEFLNKGEGVQAVSSAEALYYVARRSEATEFLLKSLAASEEPVRTAAQQAATDMSVDESLQNGFLTALVNYAQKHPQAGGATPVLEKTREKLFEKLKSPMAATGERLTVNALGTMADPQSCEKLLEMVTTKDYTLSARVLGAGALGDAVASGLVTDTHLKDKILSTLKKMLTAEGVDNPIRIACAISLCRLREVEGVTYLLAQLESLEAGAKDQKAADAQALTELRIRAQEALTSSGEFIVPYAENALKTERVGEVTAWAAARTLGELRIEEAVPQIAPLLTSTAKASRIQAPKEDPTGEFPLLPKALAEKGETYEQAGEMRVELMSFVVGTLVTLIILAAVCALLMLMVHRRQAGLAVTIPVAVVITAISLGAGKLYSKKVRNAVTPKTAGALKAGVFAPTRQTVLVELFADGNVIPQRTPAVRIAAAEALGRIGGSEAEAALKHAYDVHVNVRDKLTSVVERRRYSRFIPQQALDEVQERKAGELVEQICERVLHEQEAVLFYIRRALEECGEEVSAAPATE